MAALDLPADVRARLRGLDLVARRARGGQTAGAHRSSLRGAGLEFAQYRGYERGDEPRLIDWKLYARSDRFFVRESEKESLISLWLLIDASASMAQADEDRPDRSRFTGICDIAACVAEIAVRQGDRIGCVVLQAEQFAVVPPAAGTRQRDRMRLALHAVDPRGSLPGAAQLASIWDRIGRSDMVILLSDCFDDAATQLAERLATAGREVAAIQMLTVDERDFRFADGRRFRDPETGEDLLGDGPALRSEFLQRFAEAQSALARRLEGAGIPFATQVLDEPPDAGLQRLFG